MHRTYAAPPVLHTFRVPKQLDLASHFEPLDRDYAAYLLDLLHRFVVTRRKEGEGFKRLQRKLLKNYVPDRRLTGIIRTLESLGVIEVDHSYSTGVRSKGYRLTPPYVASQAHVCTNRRLAKKIRDHHEECEARLIGVHKWFRGKFQHVEWDRERAMEIILTQHPDADSRYTDEEYQQLIREVWGRAERAVGGHLVVDRFGRTHTVMTSLPKALRECVTIGGQNLVGIDIVNSQPLMAGIVAKRYSESKDTRYKMATRDFTTRGTPYVTRELAAMRVRREEMRQVTEEISPNMCCGAAAGPVNNSSAGEQQVRTMPEDLRKYLKLCQSGHFYEHFQAAGQSRDQAKVAVFTVLFGPVGRWSELWCRIEREFPTLAAMIWSLKKKDVRLKRDHAHVARLMQSYESSLVIAKICGRMMRERPEVPVLTIHDSILTTPDCVNYVREVMLDEFAKIGVVPQLKEEWYDKQ